MNIIQEEKKIIGIKLMIIFQTKDGLSVLHSRCLFFIHYFMTIFFNV